MTSSHFTRHFNELRKGPGCSGCRPTTISGRPSTRTSFAQGPDPLHVHAIRQAADIVVGDLIVTDGPPVNDTLSITSG